MCYVALIEDIVNSVLAKILKSIQKPPLQMSDQNSQVSSFSPKNPSSIPQILNTTLSSQERWITAMDKGKNVQTELTKKEVRRKIERVTREIQKIKKEGLKVDMTTTIYKAAVTTFDEDLAL